MAKREKYNELPIKSEKKSQKISLKKNVILFVSFSLFRDV